jgi:PhnB protein
MTKKKATKAVASKATTTSAPRAMSMKKKVSPVPAGYHTVTPHLVCRASADAIAFYKKAFGATELMRMAGPDGRVSHAEIRIGDSRVMLGDEMPEMGASAPETVGGSPVHIFLYVPDVDRLFKQATAAGATAEMPPMDMFWGDRYAKLRDPFGHKWSMATHIEDMSPKEMARRGAEAMKKQQG